MHTHAYNHGFRTRLLFLTQKGNVKLALEKLLSLEKQTRLAADAQSTKRVLVAIVQLCFDVGDWTTLNEHIVLLTKRRGQLKMVCMCRLAAISFVTVHVCKITVCGMVFRYIHIYCEK